jgi:N-formylglutamate deformylase
MPGGAPSPSTLPTGTLPSDSFTLHRGTRPLLVSLPHVGTAIPEALRGRYTEAALQVPDTDWLLDEVYAFAQGLGASVLVPRWSRYVIDLNRPPENAPMYPGVNNTELCPTRDFTGTPLYRPGCAPDAAEVAERLGRYWQPYHQALGDELARLHAHHGHALLWDGHSIRDSLPWLFDGRLPELNLGTVDGASCDAGLRAALMAVLAGQRRYSHVTDGRFKGGTITRRHGRPAEGIHAVQLEMCWSTYLHDTPPWQLDEARCRDLQPLLHALLATMLAWTAP